MNLLTLLDLLERYPPLIKWGVAAWVLFTAVLLIGLLTTRSVRTGPSSGLRDDKTIEATSGANPTPDLWSSPSSAGASSGALVSTNSVTFVDYETRLKSFGDRFLEKQEFIHGLAGRNVTWEGYVESVSENSRGISIYMTSGKQTGMHGLISVPLMLRTKAFSLRAGDLVGAIGELNVTIPSYPDIEASDFRVIKPIGGG